MDRGAGGFGGCRIIGRLEVDFCKLARNNKAITKPPEGLGVRLASAGPFLFFTGFCWSHCVTIPRADHRDLFLNRLMKFASTTLKLSLAMCACVACDSPSPSPSPSPTSAQQPQHEQILELGRDIRVDRSKSQVIIRAQVAARNGWLEQLVCKAGTREHESLLAVEAPPKLIHAALLAAGFTAGAPGSWVEMAPDSSGRAVLRFEPPTGAPLDIRVRWEVDGKAIECAICDWVRGVGAGAGQDAPVFSCGRFVFAGSRVRVNPPSLGPGEHYVADYTGSVIGLVTFGDEVVAYEEVIPDRIDIAPAAWEAWTDRMPPEGTAVELIISRRVAPGS